MKHKDFKRHTWINKDDKDLFPIRIDLIDLIDRTFKDFLQPTPGKFPNPEYVIGYGFEAKDQKFQHEEYPRKLELLEEKIRTRKKKARETHRARELETMDMFWAALDKEQDKYVEEIHWIQRQWNYRLFGYWFFCDGRPTYITGEHWFFLNYWFLDASLPEYRDRDRRWYMAQKFCELDTTTFENLNEEGYAVPDVNGEFPMIDTGNKVCLGTSNPKSRRVGDTSKAQCGHTEFATRTEDVHIGIQGKDDDNARNVFNHHFVKPFKKLPIIWKPMFEQLDPRNEMVFTSDDPNVGLNTIVDFATTADRSAYDGYKLARYHRDEPGKVKQEDITKSHTVVKRCLTLGPKIIGQMKYTTTVDEMNRRGGEKFLTLTRESHYNQRNKNGQTTSGMYNIYFRGSDGMEGFVGPYGESIEYDPTPEQAKFIGKKIGAREYVLNERKEAEKAGNIEKLSELKRLCPLTFRECFTPPAANVFFRNDILEKRIQELQFEDIPYRVGYFAWEEERFGRVKWVDDETGHFKLSKWFKPGETNQFMILDGVKYPQNPDIGVIGVDTFRVEKTKSSGGSGVSDGGIAGFWKRDVNIDDDEKDIAEWESNRFILSYLHRPDTTDEFVEDCLKAAIYTGFMVYPENNIDNVESKFKEWGFNGYLLYDTDIQTGKLKAKPGWYTSESAKIKIFNKWRDYIRFHGHRDRHPDLLGQCLEIPNRDKMTDFDVFTAGGGALMGCDSQLGNYMKENQDVYDVGGWLPKYSY